MVNLRRHRSEGHQRHTGNLLGPQACYTRLLFRVLALTNRVTFGETGSIGGLATCFRSPDERTSCAGTEGRFRRFLRRGSRALNLTKSSQKPVQSCKIGEELVRLTSSPLRSVGK